MCNSKNTLQKKLKHAIVAIVCLILLGGQPATAMEHGSDQHIAGNLATFLRSAMSVITESQDLINDPSLGFKNLTGNVVMAKAAAKFFETTGRAIDDIRGKTRMARLLNIQANAIRAVMDDNQPTLNQLGVGLKGFVPAVFARIVNEKFSRNARGLAHMKLTAPRRLVRNRKALPDFYETSVFEKMDRPDWPEKQIHEEHLEKTFRLLTPLYYGKGCLDCHGDPKGSMDVTGYPKEGGKIGDLGGAISVTLYAQ